MMKTSLFLYTDITGSKVDIPIYTFGKGKNYICITGGVHGGEVTYFIFHKLYHWLIENEKKLNYEVCLIPIVNPPAWHQRVYYYTVGKFDLYKGKDWNRSYPGDNTSLSARISKKIYTIVSKYDIVIDLHTARCSNPYTIFMDENIKDVVASIGLKFNLLFPISDKTNLTYQGTLTQTLKNTCTKSFVIECGSHDDFNQSKINSVYRGIVNLFKEQKPKIHQQIMVTKIRTLYADTAGFVKYAVNPQTKVKKRDLICTIYTSNNLGKTILLMADFDGYVLELSKTHILWEGDEVFKYTTNQDYQYSWR